MVRNWCGNYDFRRSGSSCLIVGDERFSPPKRLGCIGADNYSKAEKVQNMFDVLMSSEFTLARLLRNFQGNLGFSEGRRYKFHHRSTVYPQWAGKRIFWTVLSPIKGEATSDRRVHRIVQWMWMGNRVQPQSLQRLGTQRTTYG